MTTRRFELTGERLKAVRKFLKPALPKKDQHKNAAAMIRVEHGRVRFEIPGATNEADATTVGRFVVQMPWREFLVVLKEPVSDKATVAFEFQPGAFSFQGVTSQSNAITVKDAADTPVPFGEPTPGSPGLDTIDPKDAAVGHPLLAAYQFSLEHGICETLGDKALLRQQHRVEAMLKEATELLAPLGIKRSDLEGVLARKMGSWRLTDRR